MYNILWLEWLYIKTQASDFFFLQICFYESQDPLGQKSLHSKLKVMHPFWDSLITNIVHPKLWHMHPIQRSQMQPNRSPGSFSDSWLSVETDTFSVLSKASDCFCWCFPRKSNSVGCLGQVLGFFWGALSSHTFWYCLLLKRCIAKIRAQVKPSIPINALLSSSTGEPLLIIWLYMQLQYLVIIGGL